MRLISRTGTEGPPVSSLNCDRANSALWQDINVHIISLLLLKQIRYDNCINKNTMGYKTA